MGIGFGGGEVGYGQLQLFEGDLRDAEVDIPLGCEAGGEGELGLGAGYDAGYVVGSAAKVKGYQDNPCPEASEECEDPVGRIGTPEDDLISLTQATALEEGGDAA